MNWMYKGEIFTENDIEDAYGFVYLIENKLTGKKYIGRKYFTQAGTKQVKGKRKKIRKPSDWENYWGSSNKLQEDIIVLGNESFTRTILHLCYSRSECSYWESYEIFNSHALLSTDYYNDWISCKIRKGHLKITL